MVSTRPATAADLVALLLAIVRPDRHAEALRRALDTQRAVLSAHEERHLAQVEQGWEASWRAEHTAQQDLITELERVLDEQFGR